MTLGQKKTLRFGTVRLEWKTGFILRPRTHGNVFLRFCIVSSNGLVVLDSLENSKQYKNAGKRFRVYGALEVAENHLSINFKCARYSLKRQNILTYLVYISFKIYF